MKQPKHGQRVRVVATVFADPSGEAIGTLEIRGEWAAEPKSSHPDRKARALEDDALMFRSFADLAQMNLATRRLMLNRKATG